MVFACLPMAFSLATTDLVKQAGPTAGLLIRFAPVWPAVLYAVQRIERRALASIGLNWGRGWYAWVCLAGAVMLSAKYGLLIYLIQGGAEELIYRGWWLHRVKYGALYGSFLFVLAHGNLHPMALLQLSLFSYLMIVVTRRFGLAWAIAAHAGWNWMISYS